MSKQESIATYARSCFVASSLVISKCECGCVNTKLLLLDRKDRVRATATAAPDDLIKMARTAKTDEPMRIEPLN